MRDGVDLFHEGLQGAGLLLDHLEERHYHALAESVGGREVGELVDEVEVEGRVGLVARFGGRLGVALVLVAVEAFPHAEFTIYRRINGRKGWMESMGLIGFEKGMGGLTWLCDQYNDILSELERWGGCAFLPALQAHSPQFVGQAEHIALCELSIDPASLLVLPSVAGGRAYLRVLRALLQHLLPSLLGHALLPLQVHRVDLPFYLLLLLPGLLAAQTGLCLVPAPARGPLLRAGVDHRDGGPAHEGDGLAGAAAFVVELLFGGYFFEGGYVVRVDEVGGDEGEGEDGLPADLRGSPLVLDHLRVGLPHEALVKGDALLAAQEVVLVLVDLLDLPPAQPLEDLVPLLLLCWQLPVGAAEALELFALVEPAFLPGADVCGEHGAHLGLEVADGVAPRALHAEVDCACRALVQHIEI